MNQRTRVLVVEDTQSWQDIFKEALLGEGYHVRAAGSYAEAKTILDRQSFDVAVLDIRLSEGDTKNTDGMKVLEDIRNAGDRTSVIIVSGYATVGLTRDAFKRFSVLDFLQKDQFDEPEFLELIRRGIQEAQTAGYGDISLSENLLKEPGRTIPTTSFLPGSHQDREELLRKMLEDFWPLSNTPPSTTKVIETWDGEHIVQIMGWSKGIGEAIVLRLGPRDVIKRESQNYSKYIKGLTENVIPTVKVGPFYQSDLGGLLYIQEGAEFAPLRDFISFYEDETTFNVIQALNNTFRRVYDLYISKGIDRVKVDLSLVYQSVVQEAVAYQKRETEEEEYYLKQLDEDDRKFYLAERNQQDQISVNPIEYVQSARFIFDSPVAIVHGDLRAENIVADFRTRVWLIGFYNTGISDVMLTGADQVDSVAFRAYQVGKRNLLHDFASMEVSIRKTLLNLNADTMEAFDQALCEPEEFGQPLSFQSTLVIPQLEKAYQVIARLRELAFEIVEFEGDMKLYYAELLHQYLHAYLHLPDGPGKKQLWMSCARLATQLDKQG